MGQDTSEQVDAAIGKVHHALTDVSEGLNDSICTLHRALLKDIANDTLWIKAAESILQTASKRASVLIQLAEDQDALNLFYTILSVGSSALSDVWAERLLLTLFTTKSNCSLRSEEELADLCGGILLLGPLLGKAAYPITRKGFDLGQSLVKQLDVLYVSDNPPKQLKSLYIVTLFGLVPSLLGFLVIGDYASSILSGIASSEGVQNAIKGNTFLDNWINGD